ncbi:hypothetical protein DFH09DRAFT_1269862 [Mycena vulgaris]|nr:hypothetical protein DFH09DRAFT_1269862 [Mycena vulgaris]
MTWAPPGTNFPNPHGQRVRILSLHPVGSWQDARVTPQEQALQKDWAGSLVAGSDFPAANRINGGRTRKLAHTLPAASGVPAPRKLANSRTGGWKLLAPQLAATERSVFIVATRLIEIPKKNNRHCHPRQRFDPKLMAVPKKRGGVADGRKGGKCGGRGDTNSKMVPDCEAKKKTGSRLKRLWPVSRADLVLSTDSVPEVAPGIRGLNAGEKKCGGRTDANSKMITDREENTSPKGSTIVKPVPNYVRQVPVRSPRSRASLHSAPFQGCWLSDSESAVRRRGSESTPRQP